MSTFNMQLFCNLWIYGLSGIRELCWNYWFQKADCHFPAISDSVGPSTEQKRKGMETPERKCLNKVEQIRISQKNVNEFRIVFTWSTHSYALKSPDPFNDLWGYLYYKPGSDCKESKFPERGTLKGHFSCAFFFFFTLDYPIFQIVKNL